MATFEVNFGVTQSFVTDPKKNSADVTLANAGFLRRATHHAAATVNYHEVHLCHVLWLMQQQFTNAGALTGGDLVKIADWPSHNRLVAFALKNTRAIPGLTISFVTSNPPANQPAVIWHEFSQVNANPPPAYATMLDTAAPTSLNMGVEGSHVWKFVDNVDAYNPASVGSLYIRLDAIPQGGITVPSVGPSCAVDDVPVDIRFRLTFEQYQY